MKLIANVLLPLSLIASEPLAAPPSKADGEAGAANKVYVNTLTPIDKPAPILAERPEFVEPMTEPRRFQAPPLVVEEDGDLSVRAWRFSYNARGIIEIPNRIAARRTAIIVVHPWGIDDGQGWTTPEPAGAAFQCTPEKNRQIGRHLEVVVAPFLDRWRDKVGVVLYSLIGSEDPIRKKLYRSIRGRPSPSDRKAGASELARALGRFTYLGGDIPGRLSLSNEQTVSDYFRQFPGLDASDRFDPPGFWKLPVPLHKALRHQPDDVVFYDPDGYPALRDFLRREGVRHVLLAGYNTDMCYARTTAGYENLDDDFNVFLVGDATLATFPGNHSPARATNAHLAFAALDHLITQTSWIGPTKGASK